MSSPEHNESLVVPCVEEVLGVLDAAGLTVQADGGDWSKLLVRGLEKRYSLYLRDVQELDE